MPAPVFDVNAYWYRPEFAKSRGMVHWHGLCWHSDKQPHQLLFEAVQYDLSDDNCAERLSEWAKENIGLTALHLAGTWETGESKKDLWPPPEGSAPPPPEEKSPLLKLLFDVSSSQASLLEDHLLLTNRLNIHRCPDYCLTVANKSSFQTKKLGCIHKVGGQMVTFPLFCQKVGLKILLLMISWPLEST